MRDVTDRPTVIVIGGGGAGLACAITAAEHGGQVTLIEKSEDVGGTLHIAAGQMSAAGTRRQRELGIDDHPDRHFEEIMRLSGGTADPALLRLAVDEAPATLEWLEELGVEFDPATPTIYHGHEPYLVARTTWGVGGALSVLAALRPRLDAAIAGGSVELRLHHEVTELIVEAERVVGVRFVGPDGAGELRADAVAVTTGGYASRPDRFGPLTPGSPAIAAARLTSTGDGIAAAMRVGARFRGAEHHLPTVGSIEEPVGSGAVPRGDYAMAGWIMLNPSARRPREIHVNALGQRFHAEDDRSPDRRERALLRQPGVRCWVVFDETARLAGEPLDSEWDDGELLRRVADGRSAWKSDTLTGLAGQAGLDPDRLTETVARWNGSVERGHDYLGRIDFGHPVITPPFYAVLVSGVTVVTFGGLHVDAELRVLNADGDPIPGLFAAGEAIGAASTMGNSYCGGMCVTPAVGFGRRLGRRLGDPEGPGNKL